MTTVALFIGVMVFLAAGDLVAGLIRPSVGSTLSGRVAFGLVAGPGTVAFLSFVTNLVGLPLGCVGSWCVGAVVVATWLATRRGRSGELRAWPTSDWRSVPPALLLGASVAVGLLFALSFPPVKDSLVNWSLKTLVLFEDRTIFTEDFTAENRHLFHPNYPLLGPLAQVFLYGIRGEPIDHAAKIVYPLMHLGIVLLVWSTFRRALPGWLALLIAALLAATPHFYRTSIDFRFAGSGPSGYADPLFASLAGGACLQLAAWLKGRCRGDLWSGTYLLALALFAKNEGIPLVVAVGAGSTIALLRDRLRGVPFPPIRETLVAGVILLAVAVPWFGYRSTIPSIDEDYAARMRPEFVQEGAWRTPTIVVFTVQELLGSDSHGLIWPLLLFALVSMRRRLGESQNLMLVTVLVLMPAVYFAVFVVTPLPIVDSLYTSIPRTLFHLAGVAVVLTGVLLVPRESRWPSTDEPAP